MAANLFAGVLDTTLPTSEKFVLLVLANHAHPDGTNVYPSQRTVARETSQSVRTVQRCLKKLVQLGYIRVDRPANYQGRKTVTYAINLEAIVSHRAATSRSDARPRIECSDTASEVSASQPPRTHDSVSDNSRHSDGQTVSKPSIEPSTARRSARLPAGNQTTAAARSWYNRRNLTREERKAVWENKCLRWLRAHLPEQRYFEIADAYSQGEAWAKKEFERASEAMNAMK